MNLRYKQPKNQLLNEQQTEKEIRTDLNNKVLKYGMRKHEMR
jgi:hypothetical protein